MAKKEEEVNLTLQNRKERIQEQIIGLCSEYCDLLVVNETVAINQDLVKKEVNIGYLHVTIQKGKYPF